MSVVDAKRRLGGGSRVKRGGIRCIERRGQDNTYGNIQRLDMTDGG